MREEQFYYKDRSIKWKVGIQKLLSSLAESTTIDGHNKHYFDNSDCVDDMTEPCDDDKQGS